MIKSNMKRIRIYATIVSVVFSLHHYTANAAEPVFQLSEISENEFSEAFSQRSKYQVHVDTVTSPQICKIICDKIIERLGSMDESDAMMYNPEDFKSDACTIVKFPFGWLAAIVHAAFENREYWFFNEADYRFAAETGTLPEINGMHHCVSQEGYMATWQDRGYDSKADISVYRLQDSGIQLITRYPDVEISSWEQVCWGDGNTFYIRGVYHNDDEESQADEKSIPKCLKFTLSR